MARSKTTVDLTPEAKSENVSIKPPKFGTAAITIIGTAPLVINAFSAKAREQMRGRQDGTIAKSKKNREPKDFDACYEAAKHKSTQGWCGIPAPAFRNALIAACRTIDYKMTLAKLSLFVEADGFDEVDGTPLVKITKGEPKYVEHMVRNETGVADIRPRPMWAEGWEAVVRVRWDADQFNAQDVVNLLARVGGQVGVCEGRPFSKNSAGMGWGLFRIKEGANG